MVETAKPANDVKRARDRAEQLDLELDASFPASDPPSVTQPGTRLGGPEPSEPKDDKPRSRMSR